MTSRRELQALYHTARWRRLRRQFLQQHPLCKFHMESGKLVPSEVVDHVVPHKGNTDLFWDEGNLQALCKWCHDSLKRRVEVSRVHSVAFDEHGLPRDGKQHW